MPAVKDVGEPYRENLMHGSMGGGRNLVSVGSVGATLAPPAYPTHSPRCSSARSTVERFGEGCLGLAGSSLCSALLHRLGLRSYLEPELV